MTDTTMGAETAGGVPPRPHDQRGHTLEYWPTEALRDEFAKGHDEIGNIRISEELAWREKNPTSSPQDFDATYGPDDEAYDPTAHADYLADLVKGDGFEKAYYRRSRLPYVRHPFTGLSVYPMEDTTQIHYPAKGTDRAWSVVSVTRATSLYALAEVSTALAQMLTARRLEPVIQPGSPNLR